jgi:uncharacterized surface protein with fasciclin (FAS1) repeats
MNTNRLVKIIIIIALLAVGGFTLRAVLNTREFLSPAPVDAQAELIATDSQRETISDGTQKKPISDETEAEPPMEEVQEEPTQAAEMEEPEAEAQPVGSSALDLARIVELSVIPHDFAIDAQGNLFVVGADTENPQILKYDQDGNQLTSWGSQGSGEGQFAFASPPEGPPLEGGFVTLDEMGDVYVSDPYNNRVQKFDSDGNFLGMWTTLGEGGAAFNVPGPLSADLNGNIYVADFDGVHQFNLDGTYVRMFATAGEVASDSQGNLYSTIAFQNMVAKLDENGQVQATWGGEGDSEDGMFDFPMLIEMDNNDTIYIADHSGRLQIFDTEGNYQGKFNITTYEHLQLKTPAIVAMDAENYIYVGAGDRMTVYVLRSLHESETTETYPEGSIAATLEADGRFSTFLKFFDELRGADLRPWPLLQNPEYSVSLFVPTDEAFSALPPEILDRLAIDKTYALDLLTLHTIDKKLYSKDFGLLKTWPTGLANQQVVIEIDGDEIKFEGANVTETDIEAGNYSTIHVIDSVTGLDRVDGN